MVDDEDARIVKTSSDAQESKQTWTQLREGKLEFKNGSTGKFVYVPDNYQFETREGMTEILKLLGISERPSLSFSFPKNRGIVAPLRKKVENNKDDSIDRSSNNENATPEQNGNSDETSQDGSFKNDDQNTKNRPQKFLRNTSRELMKMVNIGKNKGAKQPELSHGRHEQVPTGEAKSLHTGAMFPLDAEDSQDPDSSNNTFFDTSPQGVPVPREHEQNSAGHTEQDIHVKPGDEGSLKTEDCLNNTVTIDSGHSSSNTSGLDKSSTNSERVLTDEKKMEIEKDHDMYVTGIVTNLLTAIAEFQNTLFLIAEPSGENVFARLACKVATEFNNDTKTLGLFDIDCGGSDDGAGGTLSNSNCSTAFEVETCTMPRGEEFSILTKSVKHFDETKNGGLASEVSHRLVFETKARKDEFKTKYQLYNPTGHFACGATKEEMSIVVNALKMGWPLFVIEGTGLVADFAKEFIEGDSKRRVQSLEDREKRIEEFLDNVLDFEKEEEAKSEGKALLKSDSGMFSNYSPQSYYIIEQDSRIPSRKKDSKGQPISGIQREKLEITKIMSTAFNTTNEIGATERDKDAIEQCHSLSKQLQIAKRRYKYQAIIFHFVVRVCVLLAIVMTSITLSCVQGDKKDFLAKTDEGKKGICKDEPLDKVLWWSLIFPFIAATVQAIDKTFRPRAKYGNLLLAQQRLESEVYKFRTRVGVYDSFEAEDPTKIPRSKFTEKCSLDIYGQCVNQDFMKEGTLRTCCYASLWDCVSSLFSFCHLIGVRVFSTCSSIYSFFTCQPMKSWKTSSELGNNNVPHNILRRLFTSGKSYRKWQITYFNKKYAAREEEEDLEAQQNLFAHTKLDNALRKQILGDDKLKKRFEKVEKERAEYAKLTEENKNRDDRRQYRIISLKTYIKLRLIPKMEDFENKLPRYIFWRNFNQIITIGFTAASTLLVSLDKEILVPISLGIAAAADSFSNFYEYEGKAPVLHTAISDLKKILIEVEGLGTLEQRLPKSKQWLIDRSEAAILSHYEFAAEMALTAGRDSSEKEKIIDEQSKKIIEKMKRKVD